MSEKKKSVLIQAAEATVKVSEQLVEIKESLVEILSKQMTRIADNLEEANTTLWYIATEMATQSDAAAQAESAKELVSASFPQRTKPKTPVKEVS